MKKSFLAILLVLLVVLIGYQVYQNRIQVSDGDVQAKVFNPKVKSEKKNTELTFGSASSTLNLDVNSATNKVDGMTARFTVRVSAGAKYVKLPIGARIDLINVTATSGQPMTVASARVTSISVDPANAPIPAGTTMPAYFTNTFKTSSAVPPGPYKAVLRQFYIGDRVYEAKMGTNVVVYTP